MGVIDEKWAYPLPKSRMGWLCPRCGEINSPDAGQCACDAHRIRYTVKPVSQEDIDWLMNRIKRSTGAITLPPDDPDEIREQEGLKESMHVKQRTEVEKT